MIRNNSSKLPVRSEAKQLVVAFPCFKYWDTQQMPQKSLAGKRVKQVVAGKCRQV